jgi:hypothetical protein
MNSPMYSVERYRDGRVRISLSLNSETAVEGFVVKEDPRDIAAREAALRDAATGVLDYCSNQLSEHWRGRLRDALAAKGNQ